MSTMPTEPRRLVRTRQAAEILGLAPSTLEKMRVRGDGPEYIRVGARAVAYDVAALAAFIASRPTGRSTAELAAR